MIDASNNLSSSRALNTAENNVAQLRATPPAPQQAPARQAENVQGVQVQISTAAREAAARDPVQATTDTVTNADARGPVATQAAAQQQQAPSSAAASSDPAAANAARGAASADTNVPASSGSRQAMQLFMQNNGTGNEAPSSPLRASA